MINLFDNYHSDNVFLLEELVPTTNFVSGDDPKTLFPGVRSSIHMKFIIETCVSVRALMFWNTLKILFRYPFYN